MEFVRKLKVIRESGEENYVYFVRENRESQFKTITYNVGIMCGDKLCEVEDFSVSKTESVNFCTYLYEENVSLNHLFLIGEEFITKNYI
ncbi:MAG: hypothetical protein ACI3XA_10045 [Clostridia bacterium]